MADNPLDRLKQKYQSVLNSVQQQRAQLKNVHIENGKLLIRAEAPSQEAKNRIWDQIKLVDPNYSSDLVADITVAAGATEPPRVQTATAGGGMGGQQTYTVQPGDTLSKIAREVYGDAKQYQRIFEANRDKLNDPNKILPGQQLVIPQ